MTTIIGVFDRQFEALTGHKPFAWQRRLFREHFAKGDLPAALDLPTGLGKTSVMAIWYLALKARARVPRRLVYVVDRRAVVDQATTVADRIKERSGDGALRVSTLRGKHVDNREWQEDPAAAFGRLSHINCAVGAAHVGGRWKIKNRRILWPII